MVLLGTPPGSSISVISGEFRILYLIRRVPTSCVCSCFHLVPNAVHLCMHVQRIRAVSEATWLV